MKIHWYSRLNVLVLMIACSAPNVWGGQIPQLTQMRYYSGQNVVPVFEGWEKNADGTFSLVFGYLNRNYEEQPEIPLGGDNNFSPGTPDRGQPTHFYPRRQQFMFKVRVPADFGKQELVWTLTRNGRTEKAVGHLQLEYELTDGVYSMNRFGLATDAASALPNKPPTISVDGPVQRLVSVNSAVSLTAVATDDGIPKPEPRRSAVERGGGEVFGGGNLASVREGPTQQAIVKPSRNGLAVTWTHWRGPGRVTFNPMTAVVKDGKVATQASFSEPGVYVIRAYADDGVRMEPADVTVTVGAGSATSEQR